MSKMLNDYKVDFRHQETLAEVARSWRREARNENLSYFNIVEFVECVLRSKAKRPFKLNFFEAAEGDKPAFVKFRPQGKIGKAELWVDREVWDLAKIGDPTARFIIAHEIGHLLFHDHHAKAFSNSPDDQIKFAQLEYSAEWQANTFALFFLMPDLIVAAYSDVAELSAACGVTEEIALQRLVMSPRLAQRYNSRKSGICPDCGGFTISNSGCCLSAACKSKPVARSVG